MTFENAMKSLLLLIAISMTAYASIESDPQLEGNVQQQLTRRWDKWLSEEVIYVISEKERDIFLKLETDEQRERFVERFWLERDPTLGTEKNEYKEEHYRRLEYANKFYGRDTFRPGWKTDRGRIYIILGKPKDIQRYPSTSILYPCELWFYQAEGIKGIPPFFYLMFFKRQNVGEMILYRHGLHRPENLVAGSRIGQDVFKQLKSVSHEIAHAAYTYLPDESPLLSLNNLSMSSISLLAKIANIKNVGIDTTYAQGILTGMEEVNVQYRLGDYQVAYVVQAYIDALGNAFIDYAFEYKPEQLEVGQYDDNIYGALEVVARLADESGTTLLSVQRDIELNYPSERFQNIRSNPVLFQDRLACLPGRYELTLVITNKVSKKYCFFTVPVSFPTDNNGDITTGIGNLVLNQNFVRIDENNPGFLFPFEISLGRLLPAPTPWFSKTSSIHAYCQVYMSVDELHAMPETVEMRISISDRIGSRKASGAHLVPKSSFNNHTFDYLAPLPLANLVPGEYSVTVEADFSQQLRYKRTAQFKIVEETVGLPTVLRRKGATTRHSEQLYEYGRMLEEYGSSSHAIDYLLRAFKADPANVEIRFTLSDIYIKTGDFQKALQVLELLQVNDPDNPRMLENVAESYVGIQEYGKATKFLERLRVQRGDSTELLNLLAECYRQSGKSEKAIEIWKKSLELDPQQEHVLINIKKLAESDD
jgi:GWxTD domain-containing protein